MTVYDIRQALASVVKQIREFARNHQEEHFYAFAIDAGMLCLSSEEGFDKVIKMYHENWHKSHKDIRSREDLTEDEIEGIKEEYESMPEELLKSMKVYSKEEYIDFYLKMENEVIQDALEEGSPYEKEEKIASLRFNTGDWPYQGFGKLDFEDSDIIYEEHYEITDKEQQNSEYSLLIKNLLNVINRNKDKVFASLNCTKDFEVLTSEHRC